MSQILTLGQYQLENLLANKVPFLYLDLRSDTARTGEAPGHHLLQASIPVSPEKVLEFAAEKAHSKEFPIVLICEDQSKSASVAESLGEAGYINVYVLQGGTGSLSF